MVIGQDGLKHQLASQTTGIVILFSCAPKQARDAIRDTLMHMLRTPWLWSWLEAKWQPRAREEGFIKKKKRSGRECAAAQGCEVLFRAKECSAIRLTGSLENKAFGHWLTLLWWTEQGFVAVCKQKCTGSFILELQPIAASPLVWGAASIALSLSL
jgi:hypothetical protein